jgi:hypothetical protein
MHSINTEHGIGPGDRRARRRHTYSHPCPGLLLDQVLGRS